MKIEKRERIKDAVREVLKQVITLDDDMAYELACQVADKLEDRE